MNRKRMDRIYTNINRINPAILFFWCIFPILGVCCSLIAYLNPDYNPVASIIRNSFIVEFFNTLGIISALFLLAFVAFSIFRKSTSIAIKEVFCNRPWLILLLCLLSWSIISALFSDDISNAVFGTAYRYDGLISYFIYFSVFCIAYFLRENDKVFRILRLFVLVANIISILLILQVYNPLFSDIFKVNKSVYFSNSNHLAYYMNMSVCVLAGLIIYSYEKSKIWTAIYVLSYAFQVYALIVNDTFGCYVALAGVSIVLIALFALKSKSVKSYFFIPLSILLVISLMSSFHLFDSAGGRTVWENISVMFGDVKAVNEGAPTAGKGGSGRIDLWIGALKMIPKRPILGYGPEGLVGEYNRLYGFDRPHNEYIQYAAFLGIPGLLFYLSALVTLCVNRIKNIRKIDMITIVAACGVIGYLISAAFGNTMFNSAPFFWMLLGFVARKQTYEL